MEQEINDLPRREEIVRAATRLFRQKGYHATSVKEIAEAAGLLKGSIYHYIKSKEELLFEITMKGIQPAIARLEKIIADPDLSYLEKLKAALAIQIGTLTEYIDEMTIFLREKNFLSGERQEIYWKSRRYYESLFRNLIDEGIRKGEFAPFSAKYATLAIFGMTNWITEWYKPRGKEAMTEILNEFSRMILKMMTP